MYQNIYEKVIIINIIIITSIITFITIIIIIITIIIIIIIIITIIIIIIIITAITIITITIIIIIELNCLECLVKHGTYVLVSVSGGVDSMALLHILSSLSSSLSLSLEVVNFNHKLRKESDDEAVFVESVAKQYGLRYHQRYTIINITIIISNTIINIIRVMPSDILSIISTKRLQQEARDWRRKECLEILKSSLSSSSSSTTTSTSTTIVEGVIATAHHADDQIETFMMKFLRGVHISNLYPMLPRSDCDHFIKPFLNVNKSIIINYMKANSYQWYEDQSNESKKYKRNEVRLDLIPLLSRYFYNKYNHIS